MNHYEVLGVERGADAAAVRGAYLASARRHHPDYHVDAPPAERQRHARQMQRLNEAWAVLGDPSARMRYDRTLEQPARRSTREGSTGAGMPEGKGWTPRFDDDGWLGDFEAWQAEDERLGDDLPPSGPVKGVVAVAPVALFALAGLCAAFGVILGARPLLAAAFGLVIISGALFVLLPMLSMTRGRR